MRIVCVFAWFFGLAFEASANETAVDGPRYVIVLQDFATHGCTYEACGWLGRPLIDGILALENEARRKSLQRQLDVIQARIPSLDLRELVTSAFCPAPVSPHDANCASVTVFGGGTGTQTARIPANETSGTTLVRLSIEYVRLMRFNELRMIAAISKVGNDGKPGSPLLYAWYVTPGTEATQSSPLEEPAPQPSKKQRSTAAHWFGEDRLLESELRRGIPQLAAIARKSQPYLPGGAQENDLQSLPSLGEFQAARGRSPAGGMKNFRVLGAESGRMWFVQQADAPVVMSVMLDTWD